LNVWLFRIICAPFVRQQTIKVAKAFSYFKGLKLSDHVVGGKSRIDVLLDLDNYLHSLVVTPVTSL